MENIYFKGKLKFYYLTPLYFIGVLFLCSFALFFADPKLACFAIGVTGIFLLLSILLIVLSRRKLEMEIIRFATDYATLQNDLVEHFCLPCALIDGSGRILWLNDRFVDRKSVV